MKSLPFLVLACSALTACAGLQAPPQSEIAAAPVVSYGQAAPTGRDFVMHYPAGALLPVRTSVTGSLLEREGRAELQVSLKRDIYVYKHWASFDGKTWRRGDELVGGKIAMTLPGEGDGRVPGTLTAEFNLK